MINLRLLRIGKDLSTDAMLSGPANEIAKLFGKLDTAFRFDSSLQELIDREQVTEIKNTLESVYTELKQAHNA